MFDLWKEWTKAEESEDKIIWDGTGMVCNLSEEESKSNISPLWMPLQLNDDKCSAFSLRQ